MFLDEELLNIGRNTKMTEEDIRSSCGKMINICFSNLVKNISAKSEAQVIKAQFKRVNNTWTTVARILDGEGIGFIKEDGFKIFVESKPEFTGIFY